MIHSGQHYDPAMTGVLPGLGARYARRDGGQARLDSNHTPEGNAMQDNEVTTDAQVLSRDEVIARLAATADAEAGADEVRAGLAWIDAGTIEVAEFGYYTVCLDCAAGQGDNARYIVTKHAVLQSRPMPRQGQPVPE